MSDSSNPPVSTHSIREPVPHYIRTDRRTPRIVAWLLLVICSLVFCMSITLMVAHPPPPKVIHVPPGRFDNDDSDDEMPPNMTLVSDFSRPPALQVLR